MTDSAIGVAGRYVGLGIYVSLPSDSIFQPTVLNTLIYAFVAVPFKLFLGLALLLNQAFRFRRWS